MSTTAALSSTTQTGVLDILTELGIRPFPKDWVDADRGLYEQSIYARYRAEYDRWARRFRLKQILAFVIIALAGGIAVIGSAAESSPVGPLGRLFFWLLAVGFYSGVVFSLFQPSPAMRRGVVVGEWEILRFNAFAAGFGASLEGNVVPAEIVHLVQQLEHRCGARAYVEYLGKDPWLVVQDPSTEDDFVVARWGGNRPTLIGYQDQPVGS